MTISVRLVGGLMLLPLNTSGCFYASLEGDLRWTDRVSCTAHLEPGVSITLSNEFGEPISGATAVLISLSNGQSEEMVPVSAIGDVLAGAYESPGRYRLEVTRPGFQSYSEELEVTADVCHVRRIERLITLAPEPL